MGGAVGLWEPVETRVDLIVLYGLQELAVVLSDMWTLVLPRPSGGDQVHHEFPPLPVEFRPR